MSDDALFPEPAGARIGDPETPQVGLSAGQRLTLRQRADVDAGRHPLTRGPLREPLGDAPGKFAYADPPYLGCGRRLYGRHHPDAADWDDVDTHLALIARLTDEYPDGWALSCLARDLRLYLPACPDDVRVAAWHKPFGSGYKPGQRIVWSWEPVIFRTIRTREPGERVRDTLTANSTSQRGLPGVKPHAFNLWVIDLLGVEPGDQLDDLFPGSGGMGKALAAPKLPREAIA